MTIGIEKTKNILLLYFHSIAEVLVLKNHVKQTSLGKFFVSSLYMFDSIPSDIVYINTLHD